MIIKAVLNVIPKKWSAQDVHDIQFYENDLDNDFF